ncbi:major histocompatibility complex class I-related gene protein-like [Scomber japonicus]|uniref:major histocompatibility complex class I-related gene protein-like n=1 Tax=Scomber japonicus TaxID=13676 RepID=UPI002304E36C|nr:major histocompatibility complex class I-related gene protein-like [Scomber japonicus]
MLAWWCDTPVCPAGHEHSSKVKVVSAQHSLTFDFTMSSGIKNIPDFMVVGFVDEVPIGYFDSIGRKVEAKLDWAQKLIDDHPDHFIWYNDMCLLILRTYKKLLKVDSFKTGGVYVFQRMQGCEWDDETGEVNGFAQFGLDGEDFLAFDPKTLTWIAKKPEADKIKHNWDSRRRINEDWKNVLTQLFPEFLKRYLDLGKSHLLRTDLPSVSLLQKTPSSPVSCFATGFYPNRADIFWRKDGEELHEDVELGEILPNHDGSFQINVDLNLSSVTSEDWRRYECVFHLSGVKDDIITKLDKAVIKTNRDSSTGPVIGGVVGLLLLLAVCITGVFIWRRRKNGERQQCT